MIAADRSALDVTQRDLVLGAVTSVRPDAVINCAAWTAVDACEGEPSRAFAANALSVRWLREACDRAGAHLLPDPHYVITGAARQKVILFDAHRPPLPSRR